MAGDADAAHRGDDVHRRLQHGIDQGIVFGGRFAPPGKLVPLGRFAFGVHELQDTAGPRPGMGEGVDDEEVVAELFRLPDAADILLDGEGGLDHVHVVVAKVGEAAIRKS